MPYRLNPHTKYLYYTSSQLLLTMAIADEIHKGLTFLLFK